MVEPKEIKTYFKKFVKIKKGQSMEHIDLSSHDIVMINNHPVMRYRVKDYRERPVMPEKILIPNINVPDNPLDGYVPTKIQQKIIDSIPDFKKYGSLCFKSSCGGGKTLAGIRLIYEFKVRTIIICSRNAVNDQWKNTLRGLYDNSILKVKLQNPINADVMICTPQFLINRINELDQALKAVKVDSERSEQREQRECSESTTKPKKKAKTKDKPDILEFFKAFKFDFWIFDELHSLLSDEFSQVIELPFKLVNCGLSDHLPYMLGLTASLPSPKTAKYQFLTSYFGFPIPVDSEITKKPVHFIDFRDLIPENYRKKFDSNYQPLTSDEAVLKALDLFNQHDIKPSIPFKLIIMTHKIDQSVFAAIEACIQFQLPTLLIRDISSSDYFIDPKQIPPCYYSYSELSDEDKPEFTMKELKEMDFAQECKYQSMLEQAAIIVGTVSRLKEGFNCENIVYGICSLFEWSDTARIQILGRIRRNSNDPDLNKHIRLFVVNSGRIPSNIKNPHRRGPITLLYDLEREQKLFKKENYVRITEDKIDRLLKK